MRLHGSLLQKPFVLYGELFLRITLAISRRQELAADMLAARVTGPLQLIDGLKAVHAAAPAFERYWQSEVVPLLSQGYRPPIAAGFERFVAASPVASVLQQHLEREVTEGEAHPYDTHPALRERIAALQALSATQAIPDHRRAICLLADVDALEVELLGSIGTPAAVLRRLAWDDVGAAVYLPMWEQASAQYAAAFDGLTPAAFPLAAEKLEVYAERFQHEADPDLTSEQKQHRAVLLTGAALTTALVKLGWRVRVQPGERIVVELDGVELLPFEALPALAAGSMRAAAWLALCDRAGIRELNLGVAL